MSNQMIFLHVCVCVLRCLVIIVDCRCRCYCCCHRRLHSTFCCFSFCVTPQDRLFFLCDPNWVRNLQFAIIHVCCLLMNKHTEMAQYTQTYAPRPRPRKQKTISKSESENNAHKTRQLKFRIDSIRFDTPSLSVSFCRELLHSGKCSIQTISTANCIHLIFASMRFACSNYYCCCCCCCYSNCCRSLSYQQQQKHESKRGKSKSVFPSLAKTWMPK